MKPVDDVREGTHHDALTPASKDDDKARRQLPIVCRKLRTKMAFGTLEGLGTDWREGASTTAVYWCLRTMETWGTDQRPAHALDCREGRRCFEV
jgi:hypothetical protein